MKLDDLCEVIDRQEIPSVDARDHPAREVILAMRAAVTAAVRDDEFLADCLNYELDLLERRVPRRGLVPFYTLPALGIRFAFGYWPPGHNAGAHEHTAWTITAVCRNELEVQTFHREESYRQQALVPKNLFHAPAGQVGFIYEPCIHDPHNPTDRWSLSLHVTSPRDGERADGDPCLRLLEDLRTSRLPDDVPYSSVLRARDRQVLLREIAGFLAGTTAASTRGILDRCSLLGSRSTRRFVHRLSGLRSVDARSLAESVVRKEFELSLSCRESDDFVALGIATDAGWIEQLRMARFAREAIAFCASTPVFDVEDIPGRLTLQDRWAIAEALEDSGMFTIGAR
jgi:hypothetical protein